MDETRVDSLYMETATPRTGRIGSRGMLTAALLAGVALISALRRTYGPLLPFSPLWIQLPLYAALFLWAAWYARRRLTAYRYTLTDETLAVERLTEGGVREVLCVPLAAVTPAAERGCRTVCAFTGSRRQAGVLYLRQNGRTVRLLHSMSAELRARLNAPERV